MMRDRCAFGVVGSPGSHGLLAGCTAVAFLLPKDPVARNRPNNKRGHANISQLDGDKVNVSAFGTKPGRGKTGVHLRYHKKDEYDQLTRPQKKELKEWREAQTVDSKTNKQKSQPRDKRSNMSDNKTISASIAKEVEKQLQVLRDDAEKTEDDEKAAESYIISVLQKHAQANGQSTSNKRVRIASTPATTTSPASSSALQSILRRVKNNS